MRRAGVLLVVLSAPIWLPWLLAVPAGEGAPAAVSALRPLPGPTAVPLVGPSTTTTSNTSRPRPVMGLAPPSRTRTRPDATRTGAPITPLLALPPLRPRPPRGAIDADMPDPDVVRVGGTWWAYATGSGFLHLQVRASADLASWSTAVDALPRLPAWASPGVAWGPAFLAVGGEYRGEYRLYYSARDAAFGRECLSVATASTPGGPFVDTSAVPLTCQASSGGSIDPQPFVALDGTPYLLWKSEDNALGAASRIGVQRLTPDGLALVGPRPRLLAATQPWQGGVVEGPVMVTAGGRYYLFYGANHWNAAAAGIGYAVCTSPLGPCTNATLSGPWLGSAPGAWGPSGPDVFSGPDGRAEIAYHAWNGPPGGPQSARALWVMPLTFADGVPVIG